MNNFTKITKTSDEDLKLMLEKIRKIADTPQEPKPEQPLSFTLTEQETLSFKKFNKKHQEKCQKYNGAIGVSCVDIIFRATSMGSLVKVKCNNCGKEKDITEIDKF